jgi:hypothetical protein
MNVAEALAHEPILQKRLEQWKQQVNWIFLGGLTFTS